MDFLVQSACLDEAGHPVRARIPVVDRDCARRRPVRLGEVLPWRKTDWPGTVHIATLPDGYQASDAILGQLQGYAAAIQTFDFGSGGMTFGRFDSPSDGGQVAVVDRHGAGFLVTQDGGTPGRLQWFTSPECRRGAPATAGYLVFGPEVPTGRWASAVARLNIIAAPDACATDFNPAFTRWRRERIALPIRFHNDPRRSQVEMEVIVSEHYGGATVADSPHLERFWFARGLGMVRFERWDVEGREARVAERAAWFAATGRCDPVPFSDLPGPGYALVDCRSWTNFRRPAEGEDLRPIHWPPQAREVGR